MIRKLAAMIIVSGILATGITFAVIASSNAGKQCSNCKHKVCCKHTVLYQHNDITYRSH